MASDAFLVAEQFRVALEAAVRTGDREAVYALVAPDVEWVTPRRTLRGLKELKEDWTWGSSPESFEYEFDEGEWLEEDGLLGCDVRETYRVKETGDFAYSRNLRIQLTIGQGKITRYELRVSG
jgi:ketosteroid isomerase-like protein